MDINEENLLRAVDLYRKAVQRNDFRASAAAREAFDKCLKAIDANQERAFKAGSIVTKNKVLR